MEKKQTIKIDNNMISLAIEFLSRSNLKGWEAPDFMQVVQYLQSLKDKEIKE